MKQTNLIAYAAHFVSFVLDHGVLQKINRIILFGSVARDIFDEESDIDIFIDVIENEKKLEKLKFWTPTPGGTGPILVAKLFENFGRIN